MVLRFAVWMVLIIAAGLPLGSALADRCGIVEGVQLTGCDFQQLTGPETEADHLDPDGDGIPNALDQCPTVFGLGPTGCPTDTDDSDGDGLPDVQDWCPYLSIGGITSGTTGCPGKPTAEDPDGDGVIGDADACPNTPGSALARGCMDSDGDGTPDHIDQCPFVPGLTFGCPDSDGDGVNDRFDLCPFVAAPGTSDGCPVAQTAAAWRNRVAA